MPLKTQARCVWSARSASGKSGLALLVVVAVALPMSGTDPATSLKDQPHRRHAIAEAWITPQSKLAVANRCGSISVIDTSKNEVIDEIRVGQRLADLKALPRGHTLFAVDETGHELIRLVPNGDSLRVAGRTAISAYPVSLTLDASGRQLAVASLWSRQVTVFALDGTFTNDEGPRKIAAFALKFNPDFIWCVEGGTEFAVADAFSQGEARIGVDPPRLISDTGPHHFDNQSSSYFPRWKLSPAVQSVISVDRGISVEQLYSYFISTVKLGPAPSSTSAERGEQLFHTLSAETCNKCHRRGHTTYELADTLADGTTGTPKRIPTLLGTRLTDPWAWNGKFRDLSEQVRSSLETTMHVKDFTPEQVADITAYLHTLPPPPPLEPATDDPADQEKLARGRQLFNDLGCAKCHVPPLTYTSPDTYDVGLEDEKGLRKFNPPSLRGVSQGYSFFHDGRAKTLEEVFTTHGHQLDRDLTKSELADLLRFLRSL